MERLYIFLVDLGLKLQQNLALWLQFYDYFYVVWCFKIVYSTTLMAVDSCNLLKVASAQESPPIYCDMLVEHAATRTASSWAIEL